MASREKGAFEESRGSRSRYWQELIEAWSASELTQVEFCDQRDVSVASLRWWKWKLSKTGKVSKRSRRHRGAGGSGASAHEAPVKFLPVRLVSATVPAVASEEASRTGTEGFAFEVSLPSGCRVRVAQDFEPQALRRLLEVLEVSGC